MTTKINGEPPRVTIPQAGKKPLSVVTDDNGSPVLSLPYYLAWHKGTGTFYVGGTDPQVYLKTLDRRKAIHRFRQWVAQQGKCPKPEVRVVIPLPETDDWDTEHSRINKLNDLLTSGRCYGYARGNCCGLDQGEVPGDTFLVA